MNCEDLLGDDVGRQAHNVKQKFPPCSLILYMPLSCLSPGCHSCRCISSTQRKGGVQSKMMLTYSVCLPLWFLKVIALGS